MVAIDSFIEGARLLNAGISGGVELHADKWRILVFRKNDSTLVFPFDTRDEMRAAWSERRDWATVPGWAGSATEHPTGYTPPPPRRLAIYGDGPQDVRIRELRESWRFGEWLLSTPRRMKEFAHLIYFMDEYFDPNTASINDVLKLLTRGHRENKEWEARHGDVDNEGHAARGGSLDDEGDEQDPFVSTHGETIEFIEELFRIARQRWLWSEARLRLSDHRCHDTMAGVEVPKQGGVYFLLSVGPMCAVACKIGWSKANIAKRIEVLATAHPWPLRLLAFIAGAPIQEESRHHQKFAHLSIKDAPGDEWFRFEGDLVEYIRDLRMGVLT